ncbi:hypothetical protein HYPBUDRAFT_127542, partial [Hyphopichia burtonii NRRL Y-1933]
KNLKRTPVSIQQPTRLLSNKQEHDLRQSIEHRCIDLWVCLGDFDLGLPCYLHQCQEHKKLNETPATYKSFPSTVLYRLIYDQVD